MSHENVEYLRREYEALNRNDIAGVVEGLAPDFEFIPPAVLPDVDVYRGREAFARFWRTWTDAFEEARFEVEEMIDAGDKVMVMAAVRGIGKGSGVEVSSPSFAQVWTFEQSRAVRMEAFPNRVEGLAAAGVAAEGS